jgi:hypothetical protein
MEEVRRRGSEGLQVKKPGGVARRSDQGPSKLERRRAGAVVIVAKESIEKLIGGGRVVYGGFGIIVKE